MDTMPDDVWVCCQCNSHNLITIQDSCASCGHHSCSSCTCDDLASPLSFSAKYSLRGDDGRVDDRPPQLNLTAFSCRCGCGCGCGRDLRSSSILDTSCNQENWKPLIYRGARLPTWLGGKEEESAMANGIEMDTDTQQVMYRLIGDKHKKGANAATIFSSREILVGSYAWTRRNFKRAFVKRAIETQGIDHGGQGSWDSNFLKRRLAMKSGTIFPFGASITASVLLSTCYDLASNPSSLEHYRNFHIYVTKGDQGGHWPMGEVHHDTSWFLDFLRALGMFKNDKSSPTSPPSTRPVTSILTDNRPVTSILTDNRPVTLIFASGLYMLALMVYWRQREEDTHKLEFTIGGGIAAFALGSILDKPAQGIVVDLMPWCVFAGIIVSSVYHALVRKVLERNWDAEEGEIMVDIGKPWCMDHEGSVAPNMARPQSCHEGFDRALPDPNSCKQSDRAVALGEVFVVSETPHLHSLEGQDVASKPA